MQFDVLCICVLVYTVHFTYIVKQTNREQFLKVLTTKEIVFKVSFGQSADNCWS